MFCVSNIFILLFNVGIDVVVSHVSLAVIVDTLRSLASNFFNVLSGITCLYPNMRVAVPVDSLDSCLKRNVEIYAKAAWNKVKPKMGIDYILVIFFFDAEKFFINKEIETLPFERANSRVKSPVEKVLYPSRSARIRFTVDFPLPGNPPRVMICFFFASIGCCYL